VFESASSYYISVSTLDSSKALVCYTDYGNSSYGTACVLSISGTTITAGTPVVFESADSYYFSVSTLDSSKAIVCYRDNGNSSYGTATVVSHTETPPTFSYIPKLTGSLWGYALTGGSATVSVSVGPFIGGLAGLVTGNAYYVGISGIAASGSLECGKAVSTTTLLLKKQY
jgi:hypothetical protein